MSIKELKRLYKIEKFNIKSDYRSNKKQISDSHKERLAEYYKINGKPLPKDPPKRCLLEEIGNSVTHGIGGAFAVFALALMLLSASNSLEIAAAVIYSLGLFFAFTVSCLYHAFKHGTAVKRLFRRFDYSSIYLLIGATFAPPLLCVVGGSFGCLFFVIQWAIIATGITLVSVFGPTRLRFIHIPLYVILGWSALMLMPRLWGYSHSLSLFILSGGVIYTLGIIPFCMKARTSHLVWHFFVMAGAVVQWLGIYLYIYL